MPDVPLSRAMSLLSYENARRYCDLQIPCHLYSLQMTFLILEECHNECVKLRDILTHYFLWYFIDRFHIHWSQSRGSTTGPGPWSWYCLHFIQLKVNTVWISAHHMIHYINGSFAQAVVGEMHSGLVSILSWITSTYRSAAGCRMKSKSGTVRRVIIE